MNSFLYLVEYNWYNKRASEVEGGGQRREIYGKILVIVISDSI